MSRDKILNAIKQNQPTQVPLPDLYMFTPASTVLVKEFADTLVAIGGSVVMAKSISDVRDYIRLNFPSMRMVSLVAGLEDGLESFQRDRHELETVGLAIIQGSLGVAENGAVWVPVQNMGDRALPFITQHLAMVIYAKDIVQNMHAAYACIGNDAYSYSTFIAGPSKTADIEQSLVLGAHGPKSCVVFIIDDRET